MPEIKVFCPKGTSWDPLLNCHDLFYQILLSCSQYVQNDVLQSISLKRFIVLHPPMSCRITDATKQWGKLQHHRCELGVEIVYRVRYLHIIKLLDKFDIWIIKKLVLILIDYLCCALKMVLEFVAEDFHLHFFFQVTQCSKSFLCEAIRKKHNV